jgi:ankyrin repeat protein
MDRDWQDWLEQLEREQLHQAAQDGDLVRIEELLQTKHPVDRFDDIGNTPLHYAVKSGRLDVVGRLLRAGANINAHDERTISNTPLADNAGTCSFEMAKYLIDAGADPTIRGWMQLNAIDRAADRTDPDADRVRLLLEQAAHRQHRR